MTLMTWTPELSVGIDSIDTQHKKLIDMLNALYDGMQAKKSRETLGPVLKDLIDYTVTHFKYEEDLFQKTGYADMAAHKQEHEKLKMQVVDIHKRFQESVSGAISLEVMNFLRSWLTNHIKGTDKRYTDHLKANGIT